MLRAKDVALPPVHPNAGLTSIFRKRLLKLVDEMHNSISYWIIAAYRANDPEATEIDPHPDMALEAITKYPKNVRLPANKLQEIIDELVKRWTKNFDEGAEALGRYFAKSASQRTDAQLKAILKKAGFAIDFELTPAQKDILAATVNESVSLIKSIPKKYLSDVEGHVMRAAQTGMDVGGLSKKLQQTYGVTRKRASLISRDQNSKATGAFVRARQLELGVRKARWMHSHAGKVPRPTHLANDGKVYDVDKGWYDPAEKQWIQPGELINCRCTSRAIIPGFVSST
jgi:uncharacterized protein with gpF-like domain